MDIESEKDFRVTLHTLSPGQATIKLRVELLDYTYKQALEHAVLEDEVQVQVSFSVMQNHKFLIVLYRNAVKSCIERPHLRNLSLSKKR